MNLPFRHRWLIALTLLCLFFLSMPASAQEHTPKRPHHPQAAPGIVCVPQAHQPVKYTKVVSFSAAIRCASKTIPYSLSIRMDLSITLNGSAVTTIGDSRANCDEVLFCAKNVTTKKKAPPCSISVWQGILDGTVSYRDDDDITKIYTIKLHSASPPLVTANQ